MKNPEIEILVKLLVSVARLDKTSPVECNSRSTWATDLLLQQIEALVVVSMSVPSAYINICVRALSEIEEVPGMQEISVLLQLAMFNGSRRIFPERRRDDLMQIAEGLQIAISVLPEGTRKTRCQSLLDYHTGVLYNTYEYYDLASKAQGRGAEEAKRLGDKAGAAICHFMQAFYNLKHMLCSRLSTNVLQSHFIALELRFNELTALRGNSLEVQWLEHNGPAHMIQACTWLGINHAKWDEWVETTLAAAKKRGCESGSGLIRALDLARRNSPKAVNALYSVIKQDNDNERIATAYLALARYFLAHDAKNKAIELVDNMPRQGAQHIRAIVEKLLAD